MGIDVLLEYTLYSRNNRVTARNSQSRAAFPPSFLFFLTLLSPPPSLLLFFPYGFTSLLVRTNYFDSNRIHPWPIALLDTPEKPVS